MMVNLRILERVVSLLDTNLHSTVVNVGTDQTSYTVSEDVGQLGVRIAITSGQKAPGQECQIEVETTDSSAISELR